MEFITKTQTELNTNKQMDICCYKVDDVNNLVLFYDDAFNDNNTTYKYKNIIYDIKEEKPIVSQYNQPINGLENIKAFINDNDVNENITVKFCYEGTHIVVFNHNNKWFITTRKCLDARDSKWNSKSHYDMFMETIKGQFNLNDLNKDYCYHFNLVHNQNYRSIKYSTDKDFMLLDLLFITEKYTLKEIEINEKNFPAIDFMIESQTQDAKGTKEQIINFMNVKYQEMIDKININKQKEIINKSDLPQNEKDAKIIKINETCNNVFLEFEGVAVILHIKNDNKPVVCKIQNPFYEFTYKHPVSKFNLAFPKYDMMYMKFIIDTCKERGVKPLINKQVFIKNVNDTHGKFEVQQEDISFEEKNIKYLMSFFEPEKVNVAMTNIKNNMNNLSYLIKDIYFQFLKPTDMYAQLPDSYKTIKYLIHGLYLNKMEINKAEHSGEKFSVSQELIYNYLLTYNPDSVKELIIDYPNAVKVMHKIWGQGMHKYYTIKYPQHIMKSNKQKKNVVIRK